MRSNTLRKQSYLQDNNGKTSVKPRLAQVIPHPAPKAAVSAEVDGTDFEAFLSQYGIDSTFA